MVHAPQRNFTMTADPRIEIAARALVKALDDLICDSSGVYGLHLNGEVAPWGTLLEGGQFEEWLLPLSEMKEALDAARPEVEAARQAVIEAAKVYAEWPNGSAHDGVLIAVRALEKLEATEQ